MPSVDRDSVEHYDWDLTEDRIAQVPVEPRDAARLLVDNGPGATPDDRRIADLPGLVGPGDLLVVNDTRVRPARLRLEKPTGGRAEILLLDRVEDRVWHALVRPGRRLRVGQRLSGGGAEVIEIERAGPDWRVRFVGDEAVDTIIERHGEMPLPPYITARLDDPDRYQTVFADRVGSAAAPTAGLHLTEPLLAQVRHAGAAIETIDLQVGLDTFQPLRGRTLDDQRMHREAFVVADETMEAVERAERVIAVGTTTVRALESAMRGPRRGSTDLFIRPGFDFRAVDLLVTNFHVPRSTLLVMIEAFIGPRWRELYAHALAGSYRFLSFGDAMVLRRDGVAAGGSA